MTAELEAPSAPASEIFKRPLEIKRPAEIPELELFPDKTRVPKPVLLTWTDELEILEPIVAVIPVPTSIALAVVSAPFMVIEPLESE